MDIVRSVEATTAVCPSDVIAKSRNGFSATVYMNEQ